MGGRLKIESLPGQGTRVIVLVPQRPPLPQGHFPEAKGGLFRGPAERWSGEKIRIVLADDHHIVRQGLVSLLRMEPDIEIAGEASDAAQAVDLTRALHPDLVIMDVSMPGMNAVEATKEICHEFPGLPVIGLSMHEEGELSSAIRQAGAVAYVTRGGPPEALISAIHQAIAVKV